MNRKITLFELNEVPWRIVEQFRDWRPSSHFARILTPYRRRILRAREANGTFGGL
jgi:hypothetical protein